MRTKTMTWCVAGVLALLLGACGSERAAAPTGAVRLSVVLAGVQAGAVDHVDMHLTDAGLTFHEDMVAQRAGEEFQVAIAKLPAGDYAVDAQAWGDPAHTDLRYYMARPAAFTITAGEDRNVLMVLQSPTPDDFHNKAPIVTLFQVADVGAPLPELLLTAEFRDADAETGGAGDLLQYQWTLDCGTFSPATEISGSTGASPARVSIGWEEAGGCSGTVNLGIRVTDEDGQTAVLSQAIEIGPAYGWAHLFTVVDDFPVVTAMGIGNSQIAPGVPDLVKVTATDANDDDLAYEWSTTCPGASSIVAGAVPGEATFTADAAMAAGVVCVISVHVTEAAGLPEHPGHTYGSIEVMIAGTAAQNGPKITFAYMTPHSLNVAPTTFEFEAYAFDPDLDALTWSWALVPDGAGTLAFSDATATLTGASCAIPPTVIATVTDSTGLASSVSFHPDCP